MLVLNSGSSSLKYQLVEPDSGRVAGRGIIERIGEPSSPVADHEAALRTAFDQLAEAGRSEGLRAGRGRTPGGARRSGLLPADAYRRRRDRQAQGLSVLAPLHNPPAVLGIEVARKMLPDLPHVAVFDTAFFHDLPAAAATYAIDRELAEQVADPPLRLSRHLAPVRQRAGRSVPRRAAGKLNQIVLHLGNGASASAIAGGRPVDTSMGLTPMEGLVMGTRSGDIDPGVIELPVARSRDGCRRDRVDAQPAVGNAGSGRRTRLPGCTSGSNRATRSAQLAYDVFIHRLRKYIGAYLASWATPTW